MNSMKKLVEMFYSQAANMEIYSGGGPGGSLEDLIDLLIEGHEEVFADALESKGYAVSEG